MGFERLRVVNFRNLRDQELSLGSREVFLIGENGQGKSNLIEAIHLLCLGASFREKRDAALVRVPSQETAVCGWYATADAGERQLALRIAPGRKRELRVNDKPVSDRRELLAEALCICFVQQDRDFVAGSPEDRRRFFDQTLVLSDLSFLDTLREYRSILKSRNLSLKENRDDLLDIYDQQLAARGLALVALRENLARQFDAVFFPLLTEITGGSQTVRIRYRPSWEGLQGADEVIAQARCQQSPRPQAGSYDLRSPPGHILFRPFRKGVRSDRVHRAVEALCPGASDRPSALPCRAHSTQACAALRRCAARAGSWQEEGLSGPVPRLRAGLFHLPAG